MTDLNNLVTKPVIANFIAGLTGTEHNKFMQSKASAEDAVIELGLLALSRHELPETDRRHLVDYNFILICDTLDLDRQNLKRIAHERYVSTVKGD